MERQKVTGRALAAECDVGEQAVSAWRAGRYRPPIDRLKIIERMLSVPLEALLADDLYEAGEVHTPRPVHEPKARYGVEQAVMIALASNAVSVNRSLKSALAISEELLSDVTRVIASPADLTDAQRSAVLATLLRSREAPPDSAAGGQ
jgi:transcriptional regulator with XRE-family HTH domain